MNKNTASFLRYGLIALIVAAFGLQAKTGLDIRNARAAAEEAHEQLAAAHIEVDELTGKLDTTTRERDDVQEKLDRKEKERRDATAERDRIQVVLDATIADADASKNAASAWRAEVRKLEAQLDDANVVIAGAETEKSDLTDQLSRLAGEGARQREKIAKLVDKSANRVLRSEIEVAKAEFCSSIGGGRCREDFDKLRPALKTAFAGCIRDIDDWELTFYESKNIQHRAVKVHDRSRGPDIYAKTCAHINTPS